MRLRRLRLEEEDDLRSDVGDTGLADQPQLRDRQANAVVPAVPPHAALVLAEQELQPVARPDVVVGQLEPLAARPRLEPSLVRDPQLAVSEVPLQRELLAPQHE